MKMTVKNQGGFLKIIEKNNKKTFIGAVINRNVNGQITNLLICGVVESEEVVDSISVIVTVIVEILSMDIISKIYRVAARVALLKVY